MKALNSFIATLIFLSFVSTAKTQQAYVGGVGGLNFTDLDLVAANGSNQLTAPRTVTGWGGIFGLNLNKKFAIELEPKISQKGGTQMATSSNPNIQISFTVLEVPLMFKAAFGKTIRPYIKAGTTIGFILSSQVKSEYGGMVAGQPLRTYKTDLSNVLKNVEFGSVLGAGLDISFGNYRLFVDGRYTYSLNDLYGSGTLEWKSGDEVFTVEANEDARMKSKGVQIMAGVIIPLSR